MQEDRCNSGAHCNDEPARGTQLLSALILMYIITPTYEGVKFWIILRNP